MEGEKYMKKNIVKLFLGVLSVCIFSLVTPINAIQNSQNNLGYTIVTENGKEYLADENGALHIFYTSSGDELSPLNALNMLTSTKKVKNYENTKGIEYPFENEVILGKSYQINGKREKVTPDVDGPAKISSGSSITSSSTWSGNISVTVESLLFSKIKVQLGGSYARTSSSCTSFGLEYSIPSGRIGAVYFTPYYWHFDAVYYDSNGNPLDIYAETPVVLPNGFTDGLYELVLK